MFLIYANVSSLESRGLFMRDIHTHLSVQYHDIAHLSVRISH